MSKYRYSHKIGAGGMAQVYLALQEGIGGFEKPVVVKRIFPHLCENEPFVKMFLDEARLAATVRHPNVVEILDIGHDDEGYFIIMEYLSGETVAFVAQTLSRRNHAVPALVACRIGASVAAGLHHAHAAADATGKPQPLVHRDVTPSNLIVCYNGAIKIVDFGIAKAIESAEDTSDSSAVTGKLSYLAPEQVRHQPIDARTDVFQLGIVLHEMMCGRRLFNARTNHQKILAVLNRQIPRPSSINPNVPDHVDEIVLAALERDREHRIQSADELRQRLQDALRKMGDPLTDHDLGGWLRHTFPEAYDKRLTIERDALTAARASKHVIDTEPPQAMPANAPGDTSMPGTFEVEWPTPSGHGQQISPPNRLIPAPDPTPTHDPDHDPDMDQPTMDIAVTVLDEAVARSGSRRLGYWLLTAVMAVVLTGVASLWYMRTSNERRASAAPAQTGANLPGQEEDTAGHPDAVPDATTYTVSVVAVPETARLVLDNAETAVGALQQTLPRDGASHVLVVSAPGFKTRTIAFSETDLPPAAVHLEAQSAAREDPAAPKPRANQKARPAGDEGAAQGARHGLPKKPRTDNIDPWAE